MFARNICALRFDLSSFFIIFFHYFSVPMDFSLRQLIVASLSVSIFSLHRNIWISSTILTPNSSNNFDGDTRRDILNSIRKSIFQVNIFMSSSRDKLNWYFCLPLLSHAMRSYTWMSYSKRQMVFSCLRNKPRYGVSFHCIWNTIFAMKFISNAPNGKWRCHHKSTARKSFILIKTKEVFCAAKASTIYAFDLWSNHKKITAEENTRASSEYKMNFPIDSSVKT